MSDNLDDLKELVSKSLESRGVLAKLRAELRKHVFEALEEHEGEHKFLENARTHELVSSQERIVLLELVKEYLEFFDLEFTLSVLRSEAALTHDQKDRETLAHVLGMDDRLANNRPLLVEMFDAFQQTQHLLHEQQHATVPAAVPSPASSVAQSASGGAPTSSPSPPPPAMSTRQALAPLEPPSTVSSGSEAEPSPPHRQQPQPQSPPKQLPPPQSQPRRPAYDDSFGVDESFEASGESDVFASALATSANATAALAKPSPPTSPSKPAPSSPPKQLPPISSSRFGSLPPLDANKKPPASTTAPATAEYGDDDFEDVESDLELLDDDDFEDDFEEDDDGSNYYAAKTTPLPATSSASTTASAASTTTTTTTTTNPAPIGTSLDLDEEPYSDDQTYEEGDFDDFTHSEPVRRPT